MSVTVKDCMSLPSLASAKVIAGENGMNGIVNSVTVIEFSFTSDDIFTPNELAITAFYAIKDDVPTQAEAIYAFKRSGIVAVVLFYSELVLNGVDPQVIEAANRCNLPLIVLPEKDMEIHKYSDVIHDISEAIFLNARSEDFYIDNTLNRISQMDDSHRNIDTVLNLISETNRSTVVLCDEHDTILGYSLWPKKNILNIEQILSRLHIDDAKPSQLTQPLSAHNTSNHTVVHYHLPDAENILSYAFKAQGSLTLKIFFINAYSPISANILHETAQIIQLYLSLWKVNLNTNSRESIISLLLEDKYANAAETAKVNAVELSKYTCAVFLRTDTPLAELREIAAAADKHSIVDIYGDDSIFLLSLDLESASGQMLMTELSNRAKGKIYLLQGNNITSELRRNYLSYISLIPSIAKIFPNAVFIKYDMLRFAEKCTKILCDVGDEKKYYRELLHPVANFDDEDLLRTLQVYLFDADFSVKRTAELLFVHRNTVKYRLDHINRLLGSDFESMPLLYDIYISAALERLSAK